MLIFNSLDSSFQQFIVDAGTKAWTCNSRKIDRNMKITNYEIEWQDLNNPFHDQIEPDKTLGTRHMKTLEETKNEVRRACLYLDLRIFEGC